MSCEPFRVELGEARFRAVAGSPVAWYWLPVFRREQSHTWWMPLLWAGATTVWSGAASADVVAPPTLMFDFLHLGMPLGLLAVGGLLASTVLFARWLRRQGRGCLATLVLSTLLFAACNLACWLLYVAFLRQPRPEPREYQAPLPQEAPPPWGTVAPPPKRVLPSSS